MQESTHLVRARCTVFTDDTTGYQVGAMYELETPAWLCWVGEVHDFGGDHPGGTPYDPIIFGTFAADDEVRDEIGRRVKAARSAENVEIGD
ncbi:hypothetical protein [Nocardia sp. NRRL S-836]|uniref:hypothetical protein n=1 Tax=Nocardia sp. NRRL S-836 TaxID=1519492 RepID=UPI0006AEB63A|nr:hypothetical protein [Nocardia sp. NRRL S-836]KOV84726.1 hypothetical protein ADL03_15780 [Nocardia sp. NRRL S-836]